MNEPTSTTSTKPTATASPRLQGLDTLRASALLLGIVLHSLMPFVPGLTWLVEDSQKSEGAGLGMYVIHLFRMVVFMLLAGYFGRMVLHRRGTGSYLKDRLLRIGLPAVAFWPIAILTLPVLVTINTQLRGIPVPESPPPPEGVPPVLMLFTPGQLWFLVVLLQCVLITVAVRAVLIRLLGTDRSARWAAAIGRVLASPAGVVLATLPYLAALLLQGTSVEGIIAPVTVLPEVAPLTAYLGAFVAGWFLHAADGSLHQIARGWVQLVLAVVVSSLGLLLEGRGLLVTAPIVAAAGWTWTYALLGICTRFLNRPSPVMRYLADASYWMYLLHLPLLVAIAIPLADLNWPIPVKLLITWAVAVLVLIPSYDLLVRNTWLGRWLNGHRRPRVLKRKDPDQPETVGVPADSSRP